MTEAEVKITDVLVETPCATKSCTSPSLLLPLCEQREAEDRQADISKLEQQKQGNPVQQKKKVRSKGKLVRSVAVSEDCYPCEETKFQASPDANISSSCHDNKRASCEEEEQETSTDPKKLSLSKEAAVEYTDSTGIDLHQFLVDTLNSNSRDRMMLLNLEQDMIDFINSKSLFKKFPSMSSYHRMLVHRVAAYFGMEHNVDQTGTSVIINSTSSTRIPDWSFLDKVSPDKRNEIHQMKFSLRWKKSSDDQNRRHVLCEKQSKSMEEREKYQRARERVFNKEVRERERDGRDKETGRILANVCSVLLQPPCTPESSHAETMDVEEYSPHAKAQRRRQLFRGSRDSSGSSWTGSSKQSSFETDCCYSNGPRPWSSTDSDSSYQWTNPAPKPCPSASLNWEPRGSGSIALHRLPSSNPHCSTPPIFQEHAPNSSFVTVNPLTGQPHLNSEGTPAVYVPLDNEQPIRSQTQPQQQVVQCSSVWYPAPQMLPVSFPPTIEDLSSHLAQVSVSCQPAAEAPPLYPPSQGYIYAAPVSSSYCQPSPQVPAGYYGQYPTSAQHGCSLVPHTQHLHGQAAQPTGGYPPAVRVQQPSHPHPQAVQTTYTPVASHQCSMIQGDVPMSFPQCKGGTGDAGYCCVVPPPSHHSSCHLPSCSALSAPAWNGQF
uniref:Cyclic AMP-regulated phosphoprotein, 21 n=1 Tax=Nothobranchius kuhntae TaxID=321403 RepID=A0A1A8HSH0_NOTKU